MSIGFLSGFSVRDDFSLACVSSLCTRQLMRIRSTIVKVNSMRGLVIITQSMISQIQSRLTTRTCSHLWLNGNPTNEADVFFTDRWEGIGLFGNGQT